MVRRRFGGGVTARGDYFFGPRRLLRCKTHSCNRLVALLYRRKLRSVVRSRECALSCRVSAAFARPNSLLALRLRPRQLRGGA